MKSLLLTNVVNLLIALGEAYPTHALGRTGLLKGGVGAGAESSFEYHVMSEVELICTLDPASRRVRHKNHQTITSLITPMSCHYWSAIQKCHFYDADNFLGHS